MGDKGGKKDKDKNKQQPPKADSWARRMGPGWENKQVKSSEAACGEVVGHSAKLTVCRQIGEVDGSSRFGPAARPTAVRGRTTRTSRLADGARWHQG